MTTDPEILASAERMARLANAALRTMASGIEAAQQVAALLAADLLEIAEQLPNERRKSPEVVGAVERARKILGPAPTERH